MLIAADVFIVLAWCDLFQDNIYSYTSEISRQIVSSSQLSRQKYIITVFLVSNGVELLQTGE